MAKQTRYTKCPACDAIDCRWLDSCLAQCQTCYCIYGECTSDHARQYVLDEWDDPKKGMILSSIPYDFWLTDVQSRIHGWFNPVTRKITQTG